MARVQGDDAVETIRFALNLSNLDWVQRASDGSLKGLAILAGTRLAMLMEARPIFIEYASAGVLFDTCDSDEWDIAFLARDVQRENALYFSEALFSIEGRLLTSDADRDVELDMFGEGTIGVARGSAIDGYLSRRLPPETLARFALLDEAFEGLRSKAVRAVAAPTKALARFREIDANYVIGQAPFMRVDQSCACPKHHEILVRDFMPLIPFMRTMPEIEAAIALL